MDVLMSSFGAPTRHPETGKIESAMWLDDYFGRHRYGVSFPDGQVFCPMKHNLRPERPSICMNANDMLDNAHGENTD